MRKLSMFFAVLLSGNIALGQSDSKPQATKDSSKPQEANDARAQLTRKLAELKILQAEIERLRRAAGVGPQNILLRVQIMDISRTKLEQLGYDLGEQGVATLLQGSVAAGSSAEPRVPKHAPEEIAPAGPDYALLDPGAGFEKVLALWKEQGVVLKVLGRPSVMTVSGRPAFVQLGGRFPILVSAPGGGLKTEMRPYGVQLDAVPRLLSDGRVRLNIRPRVSEIDDAQTFTIHGTSVPGLRVREVDTGVELKPGQTFAVSGLGVLQKRAKRSWNVRQSPAYEQIDRLILTQIELVDAMLPQAE